MPTSNLSAPHFHDPDKARDYLESQVWPNGPVCPHCGGVERNSKLNGKGHRPGLYFCGDCREQFTVTVGSVFERSKIPLNKWLMAAYLMSSSKKGISTHQLHRTIGITYKSAWFMSHRIREAMKSNGGLLGSGGGTVEADETFWGKIEAAKKAKKNFGGPKMKMKILALVERGGDIRSFHVARINVKNLKPIIDAQVSKEAHFMTDDAHLYKVIGKDFASHSSVNHSIGEYVRGDAHVNTLESFFNIFKRGLIGTYHHVSEQHLQRYTTEFDFRYNNRTKAGVNDAERTDKILKGIKGKRLTYRRTTGQQAAER